MKSNLKTTKHAKSKNVKMYFSQSNSPDRVLPKNKPKGRESVELSFNEYNGNKMNDKISKRLGKRYNRGSNNPSKIKKKHNDGAKRQNLTEMDISINSASKEKLPEIKTRSSPMDTGGSKVLLDFSDKKKSVLNKSLSK